MQYRRRPRGFTLVEILVVLAIVIAVISTIATIAVSARSQSDTNGMIQMLMAVEGQIRTQYSSRHDYTGLTTSEAVSAGAIPRGMSSGTSPNFLVTHPLGGAFGVGPSAFVNGSVAPSQNSGFYLKATGIPREACIGLLVQTAPNYQGIVVNTSVVNAVADNNQASNFTPRHVTAKGTQITAAQAATWCTHASANSIRWETS